MNIENQDPSEALQAPVDSTRSGRPATGCDEYVNLARRRFLEPLGLGRRAALRGARQDLRAKAAAASLAAVQGASFAASPFQGGGRDVLVYVMLRGGADGLSICPPYADPDYIAQRGGLAVPPPGQTGGAIDLDGTFGMSPALAPLLPAYQAGELAFLQGAGSTDPTRSHFDAMRFIEGGVPNQGASLVVSGWLGRHIDAVPPLAPLATLRALALDDVAPLTLIGGPKTLNIREPASFDFGGWSSSRAARQALLGELYARQGEVLADAAEATLATVDVIGAIDFDAPPAGGAVYPDTTFGQGLRSTAALIRAQIGLEAIQIDRGGWDHHDDMGPNGGVLFDRLTELGAALAAFRTDLGGLMDTVTVVVMSEFGRRVDANGSGGTDHGRGGCMLAMGGNVVGGRVLRNAWQGLAPAQLEDLALPVTIDYRDVLIEILSKRLGNVNAGALFPNHSPVDWGVVR